MILRAFPVQKRHGSAGAASRSHLVSKGAALLTDFWPPAARTLTPARRAGNFTGMQLSDWLAVSEIKADVFAKEIGVSEVAIYRYIAGTRRPQWDVMARIMKATRGEVTANDFLLVRDPPRGGVRREKRGSVA